MIQYTEYRHVVDRLTLNVQLYNCFSDCERRVPHPDILRPTGEVPAIVLVLPHDDQLGAGHLLVTGGLETERMMS